MKHKKSNQLDNLLYSTSQYDEEDSRSMSKQLNNAQHKFFQSKNMLNLDQDDDDDGVVLGNEQSIEHDDQNQSQNYGHGNEWDNQQKAKFHFRDIAGNSQNFSHSLSIHRPDLLESKGMHENSLNLDAINIQNFLNAKKKQEEKVNEVLNTELTDLQQKIQKQDCLIKSYKKKIEEQEQTISSLKKEIEEVDGRVKGYLENLERKDNLFNVLRQSYTSVTIKFEQKQMIERQLLETNKSLEKQNQKLRNIMKSFSAQDKGLMDFNSLTPKRSESFKEFFKSSVSNNREVENLQVQMEKLKREKKSLEMDYQLVKEDLFRKEEKYKSIEDQLKRKISIKQKKIKQLSENLEQNKEQIFKIKKNNDNGSTTLKQKLSKVQKDLYLKQQKVKEAEGKIKLSIDQIKKKQQKIKELLTEISEKNKKITELKDVLQQSQARNQIQTKLQKERENQIEKLEQEVKQLKTDKFNLKRDIENLEKPSNTQQKLKKQIANLKKQNEILSKSFKQVSETLNSRESEIEAKDDKLREFKKKNDELLKKSVLIKKKTQDNEQINQQNEALREMIGNMTKQINQLRKKAEANQEMANKLYILQSRIKYNQEKTSPAVQAENQYDLEQINEALSQQLEHKEMEIQELKQMHAKEIQRMLRQKKTLDQAIQRLQTQIEFKEKSLEYLHVKFQQLQTENTELKANRNILHSSFYDETYDRQENQAIHFYQNKIQSLEKKIQMMNLQIKEKESQLKKFSSQRENSVFQISQLKNRVKDLQSMAIASQSGRRIAPQSLSQEETIEFLLKILRRIIKSSQMLRSLSKVPDFKIMIANLWKMLDTSPSKR